MQRCKLTIIGLSQGHQSLDGLKFILTFKDSKTEVLICGPSGACETLEPYVKPTVNNLGVIMDSDFKLEAPN